MPNRRLPPTVSIRNCRMPMRRKPETRCMRCRAVSGTKMPLPPSVPSEKNRRKPKNWSTATAKTNSTSWMLRKRNGFVSNGKWRNWKGRWPNPEDTSTPLHTGTMLLLEIGQVMEAEQVHLLLPKAILHRMTSPVTWRKSSAEVTSVRRPLKADWVSDVLTEMNKQTSNVGIPLSRSTRLKRNATVPSSSSSPVIPMRRSSIQ